MHRGPGGPPGAAVEKAKNFRGTLRKLLSYIGSYRFGVLAVLIFAVGSTIFNISGPKILSKSITILYEGLVAKLSGTGAIDFARIGKILLLLLGIYLLSAGFAFIQGWIMTGITQKVCFRMRREISEKINRLPLGYFESRTVGEVLSRITNDVDTLGQSLNQSVTQLITSVTTIVGVLIMMLTISPLMTLIALVILPVSLLFVMLVVRISQKYFRAQQKYLGDINGQIEETFSGHNVVRVFNQEERTENSFNKTNDKLYESAWKSQFLSGMMMPITNFIGNLAYVAVCLLGGYLAINGKISIGDIQAFIQYVRSFNQPIAQVANVANQLQSTAAAAERIFEIIDEEEEVDIDTAPEEVIDVDHVKGQVAFEHVHFGYTPEETVISDLSFTAQPGQRVAIVGPTGAGKTTIVKLLMRFYELNGGRIMIDGCDITKLSRANLREMFGMVLQDTWLNNGTIRDNIRYGRPDAADEEVEAAAKAAHVDHFIKTQGKGYDMEVNEEATNISQGQKQLLTIARAFLADAPILILDEATSSVDTRTESLIQKAMTSLMQGRTSFIIAHRLSTIRDADHILVLDHGDIIEQGTHEELLAANGFYTNLYNSQFAK